MKNKPIYLNIVLFLLIPMLCFSQQKREKIKVAKVEFFTKQLNLSSEESEAFFNLYERLEKEVSAIKKSTSQKIKETENPTEEQANAILQNQFDNQERLLKLRHKYYLKYVEIIGAQRVIQLQRLERQFKRELVNRLKSRHKK